MAVTTARTATTRTVTEINRTAVLQALQVRGPLSRRQLVSATGLSPATVERLCSALLREGLVARAGLDRSSGGRPSALMRFAGESRLVAAVEVTAAGARGQLRDLDGATVHEESLPFDLAGGPGGSAPTARLDGTLRTVDVLVERAAASGRRLLGVGLSVPGVVSGAGGTVTRTVELGWHEVALGQIVQARTGLRTRVENDANAVAYGEWSRGAAAGAESAAALVVGAGVGAGVVAGGEVLRGARSSAGEVGYLLTRTGALGSYYADQGDLEQRLAAAPAGERLDLLALACAALCTVVDPQVLVLAGALGADAEHVAEELRERLLGRVPSVPDLVGGALGADAALTGVAELTAREVRGLTYLA
ncbi:ROK family protein [Kineococcus sp. SYSU DK005]|uniref:ROK family protein n=1 Tax=Kineococcus sp. SYSU DK005 TaxID=3383126 RepID=UPI003D7D9FBC